MSTQLMRINEKIREQIPAHLSRLQEIADQEILYIFLIPKEEAKLKSQMAGESLQAGFACLRTTDRGLTFTVQEDTTQQLNKKMRLDEIINLALPENPESSLFYPARLIIEHNRATKELTEKVQLKAQYPSLTGAEIHLLQNKISETPSIKDQPEKISSLIQEIKMGEAADPSRQFQGSKPRIR